jgi:Carboxypeptidase regulatory-like domain
MRGAFFVVATMLLLIGLAAAQGKQQNASGRLLTGRVLDHDDSPLASSVVYLTNTRTRAVKTYIVGKDGGYRFPALSQNIDYEVYAQFSGRKSDTKTLSQFDSRANANINLKIDTK